MINSKVSFRAEDAIFRLQSIGFGGRPVEDLIISSVAIVDNLTTDLIDLALERSKISSTLLGQTLLEASIGGFQRSWPRKHEFLLKAFNIRIKDFAETKKFLTVVEVRNSLIHGDGSLTKLQFNTPANYISMKNNTKGFLNIDLQGKNFVFSNASRASITNICVQYSLKFDSLLLE